MTSIAGWSARHGDIERIDRDLLLTRVLSKSRAWVLSHSEVELSEGALRKLESDVARLRSGEPLAYINGFREFFGHRFAVTSDVLVPRPETELLVELCLEATRTGDRILDLGTGSGAIAVSIALSNPDVEVFASDISEDALDIARMNAGALGARVTFLQGSWFDACNNIGHNTFDSNAFDIIVANPPYIAASHPALEKLQHEPQMALVSGTDGLDALRVIIAGARQRCRRLLAVEHGYDQGTAVRDLMYAAGFRQVETLRDLAGLDRITRGEPA